MQSLGSVLPLQSLELCFLLNSATRNVWRLSCLLLTKPVCFFSAVYTDVDVMFWSTFDPCTVDRPAVIALTPEVNHRGDPYDTYNSGVMLMNISVRLVSSLVSQCCAW